MIILLALLSVHFVADFILQTDWQAQNKSKNWIALSNHVAVYAGCFWLFAFAWWGPLVALKFFGITYGLHFVTDATTSRINRRLWDAKQTHWFFVGIGADQLSHAYALAWTVYLLRLA